MSQPTTQKRHRKDVAVAPRTKSLILLSAAGVVLAPAVLLFIYVLIRVDTRSREATVMVEIDVLQTALQTRREKHSAAVKRLVVVPIGNVFTSRNGVAFEKGDLSDEEHDNLTNLGNMTLAEMAENHGS